MKNYKVKYLISVLQFKIWKTVFAEFSLKNENSKCRHKQTWHPNSIEYSTACKEQ